jgi:hypothetical protein
MKIFEIINTTFKTDYNDPDSEDSALDKGHFAYVTPDDDAHLINKINKNPTYHTNHASDPYYAYIKTVADNNLASSNPYFPRIYEINAGPGIKTQYKMEKLQPYTDFTNDEFLNIGKKIINNFSENYQKRCKFAGYDIYVFTAIKQIIEKSLNHNDFRDIKDPYLKQALHLIKNIKIKLDAVYDIKPDNIMIRMSKYGPQLVITDPLA